MDAYVSVGATVNLRVYANSSFPPISYQWQLEGTNLPGATSPMLTLANITTAHAGHYVAWLTNSIGGFTNSRTAILTVDPTFTKITSPDVVQGSTDMYVP